MCLVFSVAHEFPSFSKETTQVSVCLAKLFTIWNISRHMSLTLLSSSLALAKPGFIPAANFSSHNACTARDTRDVFDDCRYVKSRDRKFLFESSYKCHAKTLVFESFKSSYFHRNPVNRARFLNELRQKISPRGEIHSMRLRDYVFFE